MLKSEAHAKRPGPRAVLRAWWPMAGAVLLVFFAATFTQTDADLWGHLRFGLDVLEGGLTFDDPYSFTQDRPWLNHEWLSEVQMALAWTAAGTTGMALFKGVLVFWAFWLIWSASSGARIWLRVLMMVVVAFGTVHMTSSFRPQLWTFLAFTVLCRTLISDRTGRHWGLPVLFALWANVHGGWVLGLGVLGGWAVGRVWADRGGLIRWAALGALSAAATLVTPYGLGLWVFVAETVQFGRNIDEWQPLWGLDPVNWIPWLVALAAGAWAVRRPHPHRLPAAIVLVMLAYASARVMRIGSLFVVASAICLAPAIVARWPRRLVMLPRVRPRGEAVVAAVMFLALLSVSARVGSTSLQCFPLLGSWMPDIEAARSLEHARPGRLVTSFNWGEYAIWHFGPDLKVSMDGRRETVYSEARLAEHDAVLDGTSEGVALLQAWQPEYVWLPATSTATRTWLVAQGYRIAADTERSFVAVRGDLPPLPVPLPARGDTRPSCFPA